MFDQKSKPIIHTKWYDAVHVELARVRGFIPITVYVCIDVLALGTNS